MPELNPDQQLAVCSMVSSGMKLSEAVAKVTATSCTGGEDTTAAPKPTLKDKKEALAKEIKALGGDVPLMSASVAKFKEALTSAQAAQAAQAEEAEEAEDLM